MTDETTQSELHIMQGILNSKGYYTLNPIEASSVSIFPVSAPDCLDPETQAICAMQRLIEMLTSRGLTQDQLHRALDYTHQRHSFLYEVSDDLVNHKIT